MASSEMKNFGVVFFHVDNFDKRNLDKLSSCELWREYEKWLGAEEYVVDYIPSLKTFFEALNNDLIDTENWLYYVVPKKNIAESKELVEKFEEVKDLVPFRKMGREQTLLGDVVDWCRDYFNGPKDFNLAYMLIGRYQNICEVEQRFGNREKG